MVSRAVIGKDSFSKGKSFEDRMRKAWRQVAYSWRLRIKDGGGNESPADDIILTKDFNILAEYKCTNKDSFSVSGAVKPHQIKAGLLFSSLQKRNISLLFIRYELNNGINYTCCIAMEKLVRYMMESGKKSLNYRYAPTIGLTLDENYDGYDFLGIEERLIIYANSVK